MPYSLDLIFTVRPKINECLLRQNKKLDHKNTDNYGNEIKLVKFNGNKQWNRQKYISREYGDKGEEVGFIF